MSSSVAPLSSFSLNSAVFALSSASLMSALNVSSELVDPVDVGLELCELALVTAAENLLDQDP